MRKTGTHFFAGLVHPARCDLLVSLHEVADVGRDSQRTNGIKTQPWSQRGGGLFGSGLRSRLDHDDFGSVDPKSSSAILIIESGISAKRRSQVFRIPLEQWLAAGARK